MKAALVDSIMDSEADMTAGISCARYQDRFGFESLGGFRDAERTQMAPGASDRQAPVTPPDTCAYVLT